MKARRAYRGAPVAVVVLASMSSLVTADGKSPRPDAARGRAVYAKYCALCHGESGRGDGRAAQLQKVAPADLTASRRSKRYKLSIVRGGGAAMKRTDSMPAWRDVLSEEEIADVVDYLQLLSAKKVVGADRAPAPDAGRVSPP